MTLLLRAGHCGGFRDWFLAAVLGFAAWGRGFAGDFDALRGGWSGDGEVDEAFYFVDGDDAQWQLHSEREAFAIEGGPGHVVHFEAPLR